MITVIAEKPSVGRALAQVMGANRPGDGYIEGQNFIFTWAFGHLVQLAMPQAYGFEWTKESLPMLPDLFKLVIRQVKEAKAHKTDPGAAKQLKIIEQCISRSSEIIVATDAGREGELIFRYIYEYLECKKPFKRLWISSQTDKAIREGFNSLKPGTQYDNLYWAAKSRSEADWVVGLNATQALSLSVGNGLYSIGRVQTPTLALICARWLEHKNFKPTTYYELEILTEKTGIRFTATSINRWANKPEADEKLRTVQKSAVVENVDKSEKKEVTPLLFDLTTLQQEANKKFGLSADKTLEVAQLLYERKYITYPRTGSRYISEDVFNGVPDLLQVLKQHDLYGKAAADLLTKALNKRSVNDEKVTDHHALLITENFPRALDENSKVVYDLIASRTIEAFHETCVKMVTSVELTSGEKFIAKGTTIKHPGWREVRSDRGEDDSDIENAQLPDVVRGDILPVLSARNVAKKTKPKPLHTEATLLKAMETCGRDIDDEAAREAMKDSGLGTPATRASIIEVLIARQYIARQKKSMIPTEKGLGVYDLIKERSIGKPILTGNWEKMLSRIENGTLTRPEFIRDIKEYTKTLTTELLSSGDQVRSKQLAIEAQDSPVCPKCKTHHVRFIKNSKLDALACSDRACGFILFRSIANKRLSDLQMIALVEKGQTKTLSGFRSKANKPFEAKLVLKDYKVAFEFENSARH